MFDREVAVVKPHSVEFKGVAVLVAVNFTVAIIRSVGKDNHIFKEAFCTTAIIADNHLVVAAKEDAFYDNRIALAEIGDNEVTEVFHGAKTKPIGVFRMFDAAF